MLLIALGITLAVWLGAIVALVSFGRRSAAKELALLVPNLAVLFNGLLGDPRVPRSAKLLLGLGIVWIASPIDLVPEFIPVAGPLDDAIVAALVLRYVLKHTGRNVLAEHWRGEPATLATILRVGRIHGSAEPDL